MPLEKHDWRHPHRPAGDGLGHVVAVRRSAMNTGQAHRVASVTHLTAQRFQGHPRSIRSSVFLLRNRSSSARLSLLEGSGVDINIVPADGVKFSHTSDCCAVATLNCEVRQESDDVSELVEPDNTQDADTSF